MRFTRRSVLAASLALSGGCSATGLCTRRPPTAEASPFAELEARVGGRLGVAVVSADHGLIAGHRADERFAMCSTFKMALAGFVLRDGERGRIDLDEVIAYTERDLLSYAPVTRAHIGEGGMSVRALAEAAQTTSDGTAANLLLAKLGGPAGYTRRLREVGDAVTRLDRMEPEMNEVSPGEERDTTTPGAMAQTELTLLDGAVLSPSSRNTLLDWMRRTETGAQRLRAGLPTNWGAGDKTGSDYNSDAVNKCNDVAIVFPPGRAPAAIAAYYDAPGSFPAMRREDEAVLAEVGRLAADWLRT